MIKIDAERLNRRLDHLSQFGRTPEGGVNRPALSANEKAATETVAGWMAEAGLEVRSDQAGNLFGRLHGRRPGPAVLTGSHLDSVPSGGNYDGPAGVLGSLEAVQSMRERGLVPELPIEVVSFIGEEGSRFPHGLLGSSLAFGTFPDENELMHLRDADGVRFVDALAAYGGQPEQLHAAVAAPGSYAAYVELHIEQSGLLEAKGLAVGLVSGIAGMRQLQGIIRGRAEHAGACPMDLRRDPMPAAAEIILEVERAARESHFATRATVGMIKANPGAVNVIPAEVVLSFDIRDLDGDRRDACVERVKRFFFDTCERRGLTGEITLQHTSVPTMCDTGIVRTMEQACQTVGLAVIKLPSGAVHDGVNVAVHGPVGMIFLRSKDGLSHTPLEYTSPEDIAAGTTLLAETLWRLASGT